MVLWKARGGKFKYRKNSILDHGIVERQGGGSLNKEFDFRSWHCGKARGGTLNKDLEFRPWHWKARGGSLNKEFDFRSWHWGGKFK